MIIETRARRKCKYVYLLSLYDYFAHLCFFDRPEALGIIPAIVFLLSTILIALINEKVLNIHAHSNADAHVEYNAALLSICLVVLLGFIDDVIDLRWRYKFIVPTIASIPILVTYQGLTAVVVPKLLRGLIGS